MDASQFSEPVKINEIALENFIPIDAQQAIQECKLLDYPASFRVFEVYRLQGGHSTPIRVIETNKEKIFSIRVFRKSPEDHPEYFDRAKYHKQRMQDLNKLGEHYPLTYFIETKQQILALQKFLFCPIATFTTLEEIRGLFEIMFKASKIGLFLDYNQNHWLICTSKKGDATLYYVDKDYNNNIMSEEEATCQNFSQSILFLNLSNVAFYSHMIQEFLRSTKDKQTFISRILSLLRQYLSDLETRVLTPALQDKRECFYQILAVEE
ncbi:MAG: hypothetical protein ACFFCQ_08620 [Promethearchaeota archaeon]